MSEVCTVAVSVSVFFCLELGYSIFTTGDVLVDKPSLS